MIDHHESESLILRENFLGEKTKKPKRPLNIFNTFTYSQVSEYFQHSGDNDGEETGGNS